MQSVWGQSSTDMSQTYRMAVDVFRNGMDHNVGAVVQGVLDIGAHEGVVHDHRDAMAVGNSRHLCDIHHPQGRV